MPSVRNILSFSLSFHISTFPLAPSTTTATLALSPVVAPSPLLLMNLKPLPPLFFHHHQHFCCRDIIIFIIALAPCSSPLLLAHYYYYVSSLMKKAYISLIHILFSSYSTSWYSFFGFRNFSSNSIRLIFFYQFI